MITRSRRRLFPKWMKDFALNFLPMALLPIAISTGMSLSQSAKNDDTYQPAKPGTEINLFDSTTTSPTYNSTNTYDPNPTNTGTLYVPGYGYVTNGYEEGPADLRFYKTTPLPTRTEIQRSININKQQSEQKAPTHPINYDESNNIRRLLRPREFESYRQEAPANSNYSKLPKQADMITDWIKAARSPSNQETRETQTDQYRNPDNSENSKWVDRFHSSFKQTTREPQTAVPYEKTKQGRATIRFIEPEEKRKQAPVELRISDTLPLPTTRSNGNVQKRN